MWTISFLSFFAYLLFVVLQILQCLESKPDPKSQSKTPTHISVSQPGTQCWPSHSLSQWGNPGNKKDMFHSMWDSSIVGVCWKEDYSVKHCFAKLYFMQTQKVWFIFNYTYCFRKPCNWIQEALTHILSPNILPSCLIPVLDIHWHNITIGLSCHWR